MGCGGGGGGGLIYGMLSVSLQAGGHVLCKICTRHVREQAMILTMKEDCFFFQNT